MKATSAAAMSALDACLGILLMQQQSGIPFQTVQGRQQLQLQQQQQQQSGIPFQTVQGKHYRGVDILESGN